MFGVTIGGWQIPQWMFDWCGSILVVISLVPLFRKHRSYWHWSNASLVPYALLLRSAADVLRFLKVN